MLKQSASTLLIIIILAAVGCNSLQTRNMPARSTSPDVELEYEMAISLMKASKWEAAIERFDAISQMDNRLSGPWLNMGVAYARLGENEKAKAALTKSIKRDASNPVAWNQLGILYRQEGAFDKALKSYMSALRKSSTYPDTHWNLGILHDVYLGQPKTALHHYQEYQRLTNSDDQKLLMWISELQQEIHKGTLTARVRNP